MSISYYTVNTKKTDNTNYRDLRFHSLRPAMRDDENQGIEKGDMIPAKLGHAYYYPKESYVQNYDNVLYVVPIQRKKGDLIDIKVHTMGLAEIVFVIDTTGSMSVTMEFPTAIANIVTEIASNYPAFRFGIVFFKDCGDAVSSYITKKTLDLTTDIAAFNYQIMNMYPSVGGGPLEEAHADALALAINSMNWQTDYRHIVLISDAVPRAYLWGFCCSGRSWVDAAFMAYINQIRVHTLVWTWSMWGGTSSPQEAFQLISEYTNGDYAEAIYYDDLPEKLESLLVNNIVFYLDKGQQYF
jgi:hypothetical protein